MIDKALFMTVIGSHAWGMEHEHSDVDLFMGYSQNPYNVLLNRPTKNYFNQEIKGLDIQKSEIGTILEQLKENNINYILAVNSPIVIFDNNILPPLRELSRKALSKKIYHSVHGLAMSNYKKYIENGKDASSKRCTKIARVLKFGITALETKQIKFKGVTESSPEEVKELLDKLEKAKEKSTLQEGCDRNLNAKFDNRLLKIRFQDINKRGV